MLLLKQLDGFCQWKKGVLGRKRKFSLSSKISHLTIPLCMFFIVSGQNSPRQNSPKLQNIPRQNSPRQNSPKKADKIVPDKIVPNEYRNNCKSNLQTIIKHNLWVKLLNPLLLIDMNYDWTKNSVKKIHYLVKIMLISVQWNIITWIT